MGRTATAVAFALLGSALTVGAGCTFLITFDDVPARDAGVERSRPASTSAGTSSSGFVAPSPQPTPTVDASPTQQPPPPPAPVCDPTVDLASIGGCDQFIDNAQACATNATFKPYPYTETETRDLVTCFGGKAACVERCETACAALPAGFPDACDKCKGKADGTYCGKELGWAAPKDFQLLVHCTGGVLSNAAGTKPVDCPSGCIASNGTSRCSSDN